MPQNPQTAEAPRPNPTDFKLLPNCFFCEGCDECFLEDASIRYTARTYGTEWGRVYIDSQAYIQEECDDSDIGGTEDYEYECTECEHDANNIQNEWRNLFQWLRQHVLENRQCHITETVPVRGFGMSAAPGQPIPMEERTRAPKLFNEYYNPGGQFVGKGWHIEILPYVKQAAIEGSIKMFNYEHPVYLAALAEAGQPVETTAQAEVPPQPESFEEDPELHPSIVEDHHQRWWQYCQYPSGAVTCPNEECNYPFVVDREDLAHDIMCPKCFNEFNINDLTLNTQPIAGRGTASSNNVFRVAMHPGGMRYDGGAS